MTVKQFCEKHLTNQISYHLVFDPFETMLEAWNCTHPYWVVWIATRPGVLTREELKAFSDFNDSSGNGALANVPKSYTTARSAQAEWLRANTKPKFN